MRNSYVMVDDHTIEMTLTQGKTCFIDAADMPLIGDYKWYTQKDRIPNIYRVCAEGAKVNGKRKKIKLSRVIMEVIDPEIKIDHIDGDPLNNRRLNLRVATISQNVCNQIGHRNSVTGIKNIIWRKKRNKYELRITVNGKAKWYGDFDDINDAIKKRDKLLPLLHGEFANHEKKPHF